MLSFNEITSLPNYDFKRIVVAHNQKTKSLQI